MFVFSFIHSSKKGREQNCLIKTCKRYRQTPAKNSKQAKFTPQRVRLCLLLSLLKILAILFTKEARSNYVAFNMCFLFLIHIYN